MGRENNQRVLLNADGMIENRKLPQRQNLILTFNNRQNSRPVKHSPIADKNNEIYFRRFAFAVERIKNISYQGHTISPQL